MNTQTVTPQTARLLADASFPQPAPAPGQWWNGGSEFVFVSESIRTKYFTVVRYFQGARPLVDEYFDLQDFAGLVYLPTAGDILRELQKDCRPGFWWALAAPIGDELWSCGNYEKDDGKNIEMLHTNEHECAALAYLQLKKIN